MRSDSRDSPSSARRATRSRSERASSSASRATSSEAAGRLEPREGEPRPGLDLPGDAFGTRAQDVGGAVAGVGRRHAEVPGQGRVCESA